MSKIHPLAAVSEHARIADDVVIDAFAVVDDDVEIGEGSWIGSSSRLFSGVRVGKRVKVSPMVSLGGEPQDKKFGGEKSNVFIGDDTVLREFVTVNRGTAATGRTTIGANCLVMSYAHVAHDCAIGDQVILANGVQLAGHVTVGDWAILGGLVPVHQFVHIGRHCMIGGGFRVPKDVPPYVLAAGSPLSFMGLNVVGLRRRGFKPEHIAALRETFYVLFRSGLNTSQAVDRIQKIGDSFGYADEIVNFIKASKRGLMPGRAKATQEEFA
ncbi:MAG: acyl-ACP--UDP-N-acetylglucosamine O-acyltransferase [Calditrichaeota bacterium]|nr:acyl-ACP--UDP-N-acetylglucosamine O-acyltransferase [Calditrichota bacterium]MCB9366374.1 acyl-ACP--UDP-N-acetylglucosamine O-acyltransferase [Calditrichota bacterium]MCB9391996.1 acyl-ACP--UDP-N-acetylglucosamine O-acyltransferase [Calditrichota bacterium]